MSTLMNSTRFGFWIPCVCYEIDKTDLNDEIVNLLSALDLCLEKHGLMKNCQNPHSFCESCEADCVRISAFFCSSGLRARLFWSIEMKFTFQLKQML
jgi:hypothetical protein